jgi:hypothetical protein
MSIETFDPIRFGFVLLRDFQFPGGIGVYEYVNHPAVDGTHDFLRLNLYLSKDGSYVTIWHGLLEPIVAEAKLHELANVEMLAGLDAFSSYCETLFRGHIDSVEAAAHIFKALRVEQSAERYALPQALSASTDGKFRCDLMETAA